MDHSEDKFDVFDQVDLSEDPAGDLGDPSLTAADLLRWVLKGNLLPACLT